MKKRIGILLIALLSIMAFVSCSRSTHFLPGEYLVIIIGNRANTYPLSDRDRERVEEIITDSFASTGVAYNARSTIWLVISDGDPRVYKILNEEIIAGNPRVRRNTLIPREAERIVNEIEAVRAVNEEADLLGALHEAARILRNETSEDSSRTRHVLILDTGITTTGYLNMQEIDILNTSMYDIIQYLREHHALPPQQEEWDEHDIHLQDAKVTFLNITNVAYPQEVSPAIRTHVQRLWTAIITAYGADSIDMSVGIRYGMPNTVEGGFPYVSSVPFYAALPELPCTEADLAEPCEPDKPDPLPLEPPALLGMVKLRFVPESDILVDGRPNAVVSIIEQLGDAYQILEYLEYYPDRNLYVVGSEARMRPSLPNRTEPVISQLRADEVRVILIEDFGVPPERVFAVGAGTAVFPWRMAEEFPDGVTLDEDNAQSNRVAVVMSCGSGEFYYVEKFFE